MRTYVRRARGLADRYRVDRRLPPPVRRLLADVAVLRRRALTDRRLAMARPSLGHGGSLARQGSRRVATTAPLDVSTHELGHRFATTIIETLGEADLAPFVIDRVVDSFVVGLELERREEALAALVAALGSEDWYVDWRLGSRTGTTCVADALDDRHVAGARSWRLYQAYGWGELAIGREQAVEITFWQLGTSGQLELVGTRGHERFDRRCPTTTEEVDGRTYPGRTAFPVGATMERLLDPIDVVYTWVDGSDPDWQSSFRSTAAAEGRQLDEVALDPARYHSRDELRYSLRSVWAFCGWVRNIYVVTAGQTPAWLQDDDRVRVVDHREILPDDALPTFNSHAIEACLHHIDGLSEHFIYFNDDMFVGRPLRPETFFTPNGLARVFQSGARVPGVEDEATLAVDTAARRGRELLDRHFGRSVSYKPYHSPYPLRRSALDALEIEFHDDVDRTSHSRFRSPSDLSIAASFAQHYALGVGLAVPADIETDYVNVESGRLQLHLDRIALGRSFDTFCINETEQVGAGAEARERRIEAFLESYFPIAAPWERASHVGGEPS